MYRNIDIAKRNPKSAAIYRFLMRLNDGMFAVRNVDFFHSDGPLQKDLKFVERLFVELLLEEDPETRCQWNSTLAEAIHEHDLILVGMPGSY